MTAPDPVPNVLKARDDPKPVLFDRASNDGQHLQFKLIEGHSCSWVKAQETFGSDRLRARIEPWLTALCQSEHLSLLLGSGLTHAVHQLATGALCQGMGSADFGTFTPIVNAAAEKSAKAAGRAKCNIEDQIRVATELLRGLEILAGGEKVEGAQGVDLDPSALRAKLSEVLKGFAAGVLAAERGVVSADATPRQTAFNYLVSFLMSFASRSGTRDRLHLFTTNYDRLVEAGSDVAGMHLLDRFVGSVAPVFRSSRLDLDLHYNPPGIRGEPRYVEGVARFTKLHGSLDWIDRDGSIQRLGVPLGAPSMDPYLGPNETPMGLMIYPNAAKDRETAAYPFVELFRDLAASACRPNHALVTFGYSFGDEHINRVVEDMLTIPSTHLVVISYDDPLDRIMTTYEKLGRHAQITLLIGQDVAGLQPLVDHYLPKPSIDRTTFRMAELLKARWAVTQAEPSAQDGSEGTGGTP